MPVAGRTSSPAGSALDAVPALREPRLHFVPMVSLELDPALLRGAAGRHRPLQLPGHLLQGAGVLEPLDPGDRLAVAAGVHPPPGGGLLRPRGAPRPGPPRVGPRIRDHPPHTPTPPP